MYRKAFLQMEKEGSIEGDMTKQINYIFLIRNLELEEPLKLLRQVITQKINESNRDYFFEKYEKNGKGWTFESLQDFNKDEFLDFEDRELRKLFTEMDSDGSGTIETRELFYKLTNVKEFDYELIIDIIRGKVEK
jgi:Ca2+-binding EF-hand superfamily protein